VGLAASGYHGKRSAVFVGGSRGKKGGCLDFVVEGEGEEDQVGGALKKIYERKKGGWGPRPVFGVRWRIVSIA